VKNTLDVGRMIRLNMGDEITFEISRPIAGGGFETVEKDVKARWTLRPARDRQASRYETSSARPRSGQTSDLDQCKETEQYGLIGASARLDVDHRRPGPGAKPGDIALLRRPGSQVAGPVGIADATGDVVKEAGWKVLLDFAALLSINLAIVNILPLPMLDGGRIVFVADPRSRGGANASHPRKRRSYTS